MDREAVRRQVRFDQTDAHYTKACHQGAAQKKWGRHRCRPHSYRRVDLLKRDTWPSACPHLSVQDRHDARVTDARTGIRIRPRFGSLHSGPKPFLRAAAGLAVPMTVPSMMAGYLGRSCARQAQRSLIGIRPDDPATSRFCFPGSITDLSCARPKSFA